MPAQDLFVARVPDGVVRGDLSRPARLEAEGRVQAVRVVQDEGRRRVRTCSLCGRRQGRRLGALFCPRRRRRLLRSCLGAALANGLVRLLREIVLPLVLREESRGGVQHGSATTREASDVGERTLALASAARLLLARASFWSGRRSEGATARQLPLKSARPKYRGEHAPSQPPRPGHLAPVRSERTMRVSKAGTGEELREQRRTALRALRAASRINASAAICFAVSSLRRRCSSCDVPNHEGQETGRGRAERRRTVGPHLLLLKHLADPVHDLDPIARGADGGLFEGRRQR